MLSLWMNHPCEEVGSILKKNMFVKTLVSLLDHESHDLTEKSSREVARKHYWLFRFLTEKFLKEGFKETRSSLRKENKNTFKLIATKHYISPSERTLQYL